MQHIHAIVHVVSRHAIIKRTKAGVTAKKKERRDNSLTLENRNVKNKEPEKKEEYKVKR